MTIRKRSYSESQHKDGSEAIIAVPSTESSSSVPPIIIEVDDCACRKDDANDDAKAAASQPNKRTRLSTNLKCGCASLNLLVKAIEAVQRDNNSKPSIVDRVPSMCHEIAAAASKSATSSVCDFPIKSISIPPVGRPLTRPFPMMPLPVGRPLLAPPRLPTNLRPGQIMFRNSKAA